jgi:hypothetical protein
MSVNRLLEECKTVTNTVTNGMSAIGFDPAQITRVRWAGQSGRFDSKVAPLNVILALALTLRTRGGASLRASIATTFVRGLLTHQGYGADEIRRLEAHSANPTLTDQLTAAVGLAVPPQALEPAGSNTTVNSHPSAAGGTVSVNITNNHPTSPAHSGSADGSGDEDAMPLKPFHLSAVRKELIEFQKIHSYDVDPSDTRAFASSTMSMYRQVNNAYASMATSKARLMELDVERKQKRMRSDEDHAQRLQRLEQINVGAKMLQSASSMTQAARHALGRQVVSVFGEPLLPPSTDFDHSGRLIVADGDPHTLLQHSAVPRALAFRSITPPRLTATEHLARLLGSPVTDKTFIKRLCKEVHSAFTALMGNDAGRLKGDPLKARFTDNELQGLKPVFDRFAVAARGD